MSELQPLPMHNISALPKGRIRRITMFSSSSEDKVSKSITLGARIPTYLDGDKVEIEVSNIEQDHLFFSYFGKQRFFIFVYDPNQSGNRISKVSRLWKEIIEDTITEYEIFTPLE